VLRRGAQVGHRPPVVGVVDSGRPVVRPGTVPAGRTLQAHHDRDDQRRGQDHHQHHVTSLGGSGQHQQWQE
jgi:hypothetical protein